MHESGTAPSQPAAARLPARPKSGYLATLDGWRAIAVALVILAHLPTAGMARSYLIEYAGTLGVDLFFAISGFLICSRLLEEEAIKGRVSLAGFYIRRTFRIFPPAFLFLGVIALLSLVHFLPMSWRAWWSAVYFLRNYDFYFFGSSSAARFSGHFWSLAVEEHFYLLLPSLVVFFPRARKAVLAVLIAVAMAWLLFYLGTHAPADRHEDWWMRTDLHIHSLLFPALLALLLAKPSFRARFTSLVRPWTVGLAFALGLVLLAAPAVLHRLTHHAPQPAAAASAAVYANTADPAAALHAATPVSKQSDAKQRADDRRAQLLEYLHVLAVPFMFPFLILATTLHPSAWSSRLLELAPLRAIGRVSYSLYLWQQIFIDPGKQYGGWPVHHVQNSVVGFLLMIGCAVASYYLLERPFIRIGHRLAHPATAGHKDLQTVPTANAITG